MSQSDVDADTVLRVQPAMEIQALTCPGCERVSLLSDMTNHEESRLQCPRCGTRPTGKAIRTYKLESEGEE